MVFDFGGVLTVPVRGSTMEWLSSDDIVMDSYAAVMREWLVGDGADGSPVHQLETGQIDGPSFERALAERLRTNTGLPVPAEGLLSRMFAGMLVDPVMMELVAQLNGLGLRTGLLSNSWANHYPPDVLAHFDPILISGEVGLRKPDPEIFRLLLRRLELPAGRVAFVDDVPPNVRAAAELGIQAVRHVDAATTRAALAGLVPDLRTRAPRDVSA